MKIVYMGTPDFAVPALKKLAQSPKHTVAAVFTQPDKPQGRKMIMTPPDVKVCAQELSIPVYQPKSMKGDDAFAQLEEIDPDVIVVAAYGQILPKRVLDLPKFGCVNIHGTGDILLTKETEIGINETSAELFDRLSLMGGELIEETLDALENGTVEPKKQDEKLASHTSKIDKSMCPVSFDKPALEIHNRIRGLYSWPIATAQIGGKRVKIHKARLCDKSGRAGEILSVKPLVIACAEGSVEILELQPEGKKKMTAEAFAAGHKLKTGEIL